MTTQPRILLTGATDGIGRATAQALAARGATLLLHGRQEARLEELHREIPKAACLQADFSRLSDVKRLAQEILARREALDVFIANAGVFMPERVLTEDGHETTFQVNHLAHLRLLLDLAPLLAPGGRVVVVASTSHEKVRAIDLDNLDWHQDFAGYPAYGLAKLAQVATVVELAEAFATRGITLQALHPGSILTKLQQAGWGGGGSPDASAAVARILALCLDEPRPMPSGQWWVDGRPAPPNPLVLDRLLRRELLAHSRRMVGWA